MSVPESEYKVYIYNNDYYTLCAKVNRHQQIETGGNLFGLWTTSGSAVIHVVLGPGKNCRRTDTSFHQDIEYLKRVGRFLNEKYMLCHIGEWHSHHCVSLNQSNINGNTLNIPKGMATFLVIVPDIKGAGQNVMSPFFVKNEGKHCELAEFVVLESNNPFCKITPEIERAAEATGYRGYKTTLEVAIPNPGAAISSGSGVNPRDTSSNPGQVYSTVSTHSQASPTNDLAEVTDIAQDEVILKDIYDELTKLYSKEGKVDIIRTSYGDINMTFQHRHYHWMLRFPEKFPNEAAKIYRALTTRQLSNCSPCHDYYLEKPLTNYVNIILSIKKICFPYCNVCENISKEKLTKSAPAVLPSKAKLEDVVKAVKNEIALTLEDCLSYLTSEPHNDGGHWIIFDHYYTRWYVEFPAEFPDKPAEVYKDENRLGAVSKKPIILSNKKNEKQPLVSPDFIMSAIRIACGCWTCKHKKR